MNNEEKIALMRRALERIAKDSDCGCHFPCRCNGPEWDAIDSAARKDMADECLSKIEEAERRAPAAQPATAPVAAPAASIDNSQLLSLVTGWENSRRGSEALSAWDDLVKFLDAHAAQRYETGFQDGLKLSHRQALTVTHSLMAERDAAKAALARIVAGVEGVDVRSVIEQMCRGEYIGHEQITLMADAVGSAFATLLPAKAEAAEQDAAEPSARDQKLAQRIIWTVKQWYEHVGAWNDEKDQIVFGSVMALRAMLVQFQEVTRYAAERRIAPAPAMGEELPRCPTPYSISEWPSNGRAYDHEQMLAYGRACMASKQAEIDRLMLEFCPAEMSKEQMANWEAHQRRAPEDASMALRQPAAPHGEPVAALMYMDELPAAQAGEAWIEQFAKEADKVVYTDDAGGQAARVKWCAYFDSYDRLVAAYLLTRDAKNWTQLTKVRGEAFAATAPVSQPAGHDCSLIDAVMALPTYTHGDGILYQRAADVREVAEQFTTPQPIPAPAGSEAPKL